MNSQTKRTGPVDCCPHGYRFLVQLFERELRDCTPEEVIRRMFRRSDAIFVAGVFHGGRFDPDGGFMAFVPADDDWKRRKFG